MEEEEQVEEEEEGEGGREVFWREGINCTCEICGTSSGKTKTYKRSVCIFCGGGEKDDNTHTRVHTR